MHSQITLACSRLFAVFLIQIVALLDTALSAGYRDQSIPNPRFLSGGTNVTYSVGETASLSCGITDLGTKTVTWRRKGEVVPLTIGPVAFKQDTDYEVDHVDPYWNLLIKNVQLKHAGVYLCIVSTNDKIKRLVQLNIDENKSAHKPLINISGKFHIDKGDTLRLKCNASGVSAPPDMVVWFKDGIEINASDRVSIAEQYSVMARTISSWLEITHVKMDDHGAYTCRTSNSQVTSVNIQVLNVEKTQRHERDQEKDHLSATKFEPGATGGSSSHRHSFALFVCVFCSWFYIQRNVNR